MLEIKSIEEIKDEIFCKHMQNFPESINFPFSQLYIDIVTRIKVINELRFSTNFILYNSLESVKVTKKFSDKDRWSINISEEEIKKYWFIGYIEGMRSYPYDYWIMDIDNKVYLYNYYEQIPKEYEILDLDLSFEKWLQLAFLNNELERIYTEDKFNKKSRKKFQQKLKNISKKFIEYYPYNFVD